MNKYLLGNLEDGTPGVLDKIGCQRQGRGMFGLFLVAFFALFVNGSAWGQTYITTKAQLEAIYASDASLEGDYIISADFNASGYSPNTNNWNNKAFSGTLTSGVKDNGTFYTISGLDKPLFKKATDATISNIMLKDVTIEQNGRVGAIACTANGTTRIYNCGILPTTTLYDKKGNISGFGGSNIKSNDDYCGGLVGYLDGYARVINCFSYANITGGTVVAGIVGYNTTATQQGNNQNNFNNNVKTMVVNCMFYADITGGETKRPVYGGTRIPNNAEHKVNNFNYFYQGAASFYNGNTPIDDYNCSWQVSEKYLNRFEFYRSILNSNRLLCAWWVNGAYNTCPITAYDQEESVGIAKWVLDPTIAPFPILKKWGKYYSTSFDLDPQYVYRSKTKTKVARGAANEWEGKSYGTLTVTINGGSENSSASYSRDITITDMDTLGFDFCAKKIQLPYYNEIFGSTASNATWAQKYGNNYHNGKVVTGWKIISVNGNDVGEGYTFNGNCADPTKPWEDGYNFADRSDKYKDLFAKSGRVFAQGGYYYVPEGVISITIEAYWGNAVYLCNDSRYLDRVNNGGNNFYVSGKLPEYVGGETSIAAQKVKTKLSDAVSALTIQPTKSVYDQAIVLVGNYQQNNFHSNIQLKGSEYNEKAKPFTIMSADFDKDNEPDFCFEVGMSSGGRVNVHPIRFDFLPIPDITMAIRTNDKYYGMRIFCPQGHFEITETAFMYTTQFEYDRRPKYSDYSKHQAPVILNGGEFFQIVSVENGSTNYGMSGSSATSWGADSTSYFILGGHLWMKAFTPGTHGNNKVSTRHCAVNVMGGEFEEFYLSGMFRTDFYNKTDNPHCYTNGGKFGLIAGAGMESVGGQNETNGGNVTFKIDRSLINEFYGGGINAERPVTGNIDVTCNNSFVHKYCGGPRLGDMSNTKNITNNATGTYFGTFYGGGNGGTNMLRDRWSDSGSAITPPTQDDHSLWDRPSTGNGQGIDNYGGNFDGFTPFGYDAANGYQAEFEFELLPQPNGNSTVVMRTYCHWAKFSKTMVAPVENTLIDCTVLNNFYGGGNLGSVDGDVTSTLAGNTKIYGSAYGGGFSASIPSFSVHKRSTVSYPYVDLAGYIHEGSLDTLRYSSDVGTHHEGDIIYYQWIKDIPEGWGITPNPTTSNPTFEYPENSGNWYCYTGESLVNLGNISGNTFITIKDNTIVNNNVFGAGDASTVSQNSTVKIIGNTKILGNVYGGGNRGEVGGNTKVIINGKWE